MASPGIALGIRTERLYARATTKSKEATLDPKLQALLAVVPERFARAVTGVPFDPASCATRHPERLAHIATKLSWLTPLESLTTDDLRILGLVNAAGRPLQSADLDEGGDTEADDAPPAGNTLYAAA